MKKSMGQVNEKRKYLEELSYVSSKNFAFCTGAKPQFLLEDRFEEFVEDLLS